MTGTKELEELYDIILSSPGLDAHVKLDNRITCRIALFLVIAMEFGMTSTDVKNPLTKILSEKDHETLKVLMEEILQRAKLQDFYGKLKRLG